MKFKYGDLVYSTELRKIEHLFPMLVIKFYSKKDKYLCLTASRYSPGDEGTIFYLVAESELTMFEHFDGEDGEEFNDDHIEWVKKVFTDMFPENINVVYFDIYTIKNNEVVEVYRPVLHRKDFEIPTT
ncbi:MAG: hypothetical protein RSC27_01445 [Bacilli bacterium]